MNLYSKKTNKLTKNQINDICKLNKIGTRVSDILGMSSLEELVYGGLIRYLLWDFAKKAKEEKALQIAFKEGRDECPSIIQEIRGFFRGPIFLVVLFKFWFVVL